MLENLKGKFVLMFAALVLVSVTARAQSPQVSLRSTDGRTVGSADWKGKIVVLSFGGTWVPLASKELAALQKVADRFARPGTNGLQSLRPGRRADGVDSGPRWKHPAQTGRNRHGAGRRLRGNHQSPGTGVKVMLK